MIKNKQNIIYLISLSLVLAFGILLRISSFINHGMYVPIDECHSMAGINNQSYKEMMTMFCQGANFAPFCRVLLKVLWQIFGFNYVILKLPSLLAGICSLFVFLKILDKLFKNKVLILSALLVFSMNYNLILYSFAIKFYMFDVLIVLLITYYAICFSTKYKEEKIPLKILVLSCIVSIIFMFSSFSAIVVTELCWGYCFLKYVFGKNMSNIIRMLIFQVITGIFIAIEYFTYIIQIKSDSDLSNQWLNNGFFFKPDCLEAINSLIHFSFFNFYWFDKDLESKLPDIVLYIFIIVFITGILKFIIPAFKKQGNQNGIFIAAPVLFFICLSFLYIYPFCNRPIIFLIPFFIIIVFKAFDFDRSKRLIYLTDIICFMLLFAILFYTNKLGELQALITDNSMSKEEEKEINMLNNVKDDEIVLVWDSLCLYCVDTENVILMRIPESTVTASETVIAVYDKKRKQYCTYNSIKDIIQNKNKIIFAYGNDEKRKNNVIIVKQMILQEGYKPVQEKTNTIFAENYTVYVKN